MTPPNPSPATADKQILTADDLSRAMEASVGHVGLACAECGADGLGLNCGELLDHLNAILAPKLAEHAKLVQAAAIEAAADFVSCTDDPSETRILRLGIAEGIRALASQDLLSQHDAQVLRKLMGNSVLLVRGHYEPEGIYANGRFVVEQVVADKISIAELTAKAQVKP